MTNEWYYTDNGQQRGPISTVALRELAASGALKPSDLVWQEGMSQWAPANSTRGLFPSPVPMQPPPEPAAATFAYPAAPRQERPLGRAAGDYGSEGRPGGGKRTGGGISTGAKVAVGGTLVFALFMAALLCSIALVVVNTRQNRSRAVVSIPAAPVPPMRKPVPNRGQKFFVPKQGGAVAAIGNRSYTVALDHDGDENVRFIQFNNNEQVRITVTTTDWAGDLEPDVDLLIFDPNNNLIASDDGPEKDCDAAFVAGQAGLYKVVIQLFEGTRVQCTVRY